MDIVEKLRAEHVCDDHTCGWDDVMRDAADEIERLRAALTKIANDDYIPDEWTDHGMVWQSVARRALEQRAQLDEGLPTAEDVRGILRDDWKPR